MIHQLAKQLLIQIECSLIKKKSIYDSEAETEKLDETKWSLKESFLRSIIDPLRVALYGTIILGTGRAVFKAVFFIIYSAGIIFMVTQLPYHSTYIKFVLIPFSIWMLGVLLSFFELPSASILNKIDSKILEEIKTKIIRNNGNQERCLSSLENLIEKYEKAPEQKINFFKALFSIFSLLIFYFISESWKETTQDVNFIISSLAILACFYLFIEAYAAVKEATFLIAYTAISELKYNLPKTLNEKSGLPNAKQKLLEETKTTFTNKIIRGEMKSKLQPKTMGNKSVPGNKQNA